MPRENLPSIKETMRKGWIYLIPIFVLIYTLFVLFLSPGVCALYAALTAIIISSFKKDARNFWTWNNILNILSQKQ
jgi:TRAP-type uncharacterized transport system fused permease subunit